jgi:hypothetical protein
LQVVLLVIDQAPSNINVRFNIYHVCDEWMDGWMDVCITLHKIIQSLLYICYVYNAL